MKRTGPKRKLLTLLVVVLLGLLYIYLGAPYIARLGPNRLTGSIGVVLGLFICSQPAANFLDLVLYR